MEDGSEYTERQLAKRYCLLVIALFFMACGIAMSKLADLGTTPISCIPAVLSYSWLTIGAWTIIVNAILIVLEALILRKDFRIFQALQLAVAFILGIFVDIWVELLSFVDPQTYAAQWFWCILSAVILAFGVFMEVRADTLVAPGEGFVMAVVSKYHIPFPKMKVINDVTMVTLGAILAVSTLGTLRGVREGTIFAAIALGFVIGFYRKYLGGAFDRLLK